MNEILCISLHHKFNPFLAQSSCKSHGENFKGFYITLCRVGDFTAFLKRTFVICIYQYSLFMIV